MSKYIVCDAGGTKGEYMLFDETGHIFSHFIGLGANAIFEDENIAMQAVAEGVRACLLRANLQLQDIASIYLFIPGFRNCLDALKQELCYGQIHLQGDTENALYGALGKNIGVVVLSGTGSFALGRDSQGTQASCGGWGPLIGDYGSGYHIGILCLSKLVKQYDRHVHVDDNMLACLVLSKLKLTDLAELRRFVYKKEFTRRHIADLCPLVMHAAEQGDPLSLEIVNIAAEELADLAQIAAVGLDYDQLEIALVGGVSKAGDTIFVPFCEKIRTRLPNCTCILGRYSPCVGAVLYVLDQVAGVDIQSAEIISNIQKGVVEYVNG